MDKRNKLPVYYAFFIIGALFPQIIGFNGSLLDSVWKIFIVGAISFFSHMDFLKISRFGAIYIAILIFNQLGILIFNDEEIQSAAINLCMSILLLIVFFEYPKQIENIKLSNLLCFYKIYAYFILIACLYNMIVNFNSLINITSISVYGSEDICSFFDNKNSFGVFLMFGCLAATIMRYYSKEKKWLIIIVIFIINELMAMCRTAIIISVACLILSFVLSINGISLRRILIVTCFIAAVTFVIAENEKINEYIFGNLFGSTKSLETRQNYVDNMYGLIRGIHIIFGYGTANAKKLAYEYTGNHYYHNTYLNIIISGGLINMILFITIIFHSIKQSFNIVKKNVSSGMICILSLMVYLVYAYVESVILFSTPVIAMVATIFVVSMPTLFGKSIFNKK